MTFWVLTCQMVTSLRPSWHFTMDSSIANGATPEEMLPQLPFQSTTASVMETWANV